MRIRSAGYLLKRLVAVGFIMTTAYPQQFVTPHSEHFDYDASDALDTKELSVQQGESASIRDITYVSPHGGLVPAYLVVPKRPGKYAAVLWGH